MGDQGHFLRTKIISFLGLTEKLYRCQRHGFIDWQIAGSFRTSVCVYLAFRTDLGITPRGRDPSEAPSNL